MLTHKKRTLNEIKRFEIVVWSDKQRKAERKTSIKQRKKWKGNEGEKSQFFYIANKCRSIHWNSKFYSLLSRALVTSQSEIWGSCRFFLCIMSIKSTMVMQRTLETKWNIEVLPTSLSCEQHICFGLDTQQDSRGGCAVFFFS